LINYKSCGNLSLASRITRQPLVLRRVAVLLTFCFLWYYVLPTAVLAAGTVMAQREPQSAQTSFGRIKSQGVGPFVPASTGQVSRPPVTPFARLVSDAKGDAKGTLRAGTLLDEIGHLALPVTAAQVAGWKSEIRTTHTAPGRAAWLHLWLGEWELAHNEQPFRARWYFRQAQKEANPSDPCAGLAAYDSAVALFYAGDYQDAGDAFRHLLVASHQLCGYPPKDCALWMRRAGAAAGYHAERAVMGIPEPPRFDPLCGAAALAACLRSLSLPYSKAVVLRACRVTGEGSILPDILRAGPKLGVAIRAVSADDSGLMALPKPLIAHVEHDHFVVVMGAGKTGVRYLCSDCGSWPGGEVRLTWKQWRALNPDVYATVSRPGSRWDDALVAAGLGRPAFAAPQVRVASAGSLIGLGLRHGLPSVYLPLLPSLTLLKAPHVIRLLTPAPGGCGARPLGLSPSPLATPSVDGDPVNLATGEEQLSPAPDLVVYNPHGPSVTWSRTYNSLRNTPIVNIYNNLYNNTAPEADDFGACWAHSYSVGVLNPSGGVDGPKYVYFANGSRISFTAPAAPANGSPVQCSVQAGTALSVEWDYDAASAAGHYTVTFPDRTRWVTTVINPASTCHSLAQIVDRNGNAINFNYGPVGPGRWPLLASITDATGAALLTVQRATDGTGMIVSVSDCYGRSVYYHVGIDGGLDHVSQVVPACMPNPPDRYVYGYQFVPISGDFRHSFPFLTSIDTPSPTGNGMSTTQISYVPYVGSVASVTDANGNTRSYTSVDASGNPASPSNYTKVTIADPQGKVVYSYTIGYDNNLNVTTQTDGAGSVVSTVVYADPNDPFKASSLTNGNGQTWHYAWDAYGHLVSSRSPRGVTVSNSWDYSQFATGELARVQASTTTGSSLGATSFSYDEPNGLLRTVTYPRPGTTGGSSMVTASYTYDALGNPLTVTGPGNNAAGSSTTTFNYTSDPGDSAHSVAPYSQATALGQPLTVTDGLGKSAHLRYDALGRAVSTSDALGIETDTAYDIAGQVVSVTLPATGQTGGGRETAVNGFLYPGGPLLSTTSYDESGTLARQVSFRYGPAGELLGRTGSGEPVSYAYDAMYRLKTLTDGNGQATAYAYNAAGYAASVTYPGGDGVQFPLYDADGNLLKRVSSRGVETDYVYNDPGGALTDVQYPAAPGLNVHYGYDAFGRTGGASDGEGTTLYAYDDNGAVTGVQTTYTGQPSQTLSYGYYPDGSRHSMSTPAGGFSYGYDADGRLNALTNPYNETSQWSYLDNGWVSGQQSGNGLTTAYTYNARGFLTDLTNRSGTGVLLSEFGSMTYDGGGNRASLTATVPSAPSYGGTTAFTYDGRNQLTQEQSTRAGGYTNAFAYDGAGNPMTFRGLSLGGFTLDNQFSAGGYSYDGAGNPATYAGTSFSFDALDRLTSAGGLLTSGYTGGSRAWKQPAGGGRTYFLYDGADPVCEVDASGAVTTVNTFGGTGLLSRHTGAGDNFYAFDPQGNTAQVLDGTGAVRSTSAVDAYGKSLGTAPSSDPFAGFGAQNGYYADAETGLLLLGHRYYDPGTGRFVNRDPAGYGGGMNLYGYCLNNPVMDSDPSGLDDASVPWWFRTPPAVDNFVNHLNQFSMGGGEALGLGNWYEANGLKGLENPCSGCFFAGEAVMTIAATVATDGTADEAEIANGAEQLGTVEREAEQTEEMTSFCGRPEGCFVAGTPLTEADGQTQAIDQAAPGQRIASRPEGADQKAALSGQTEAQTVARKTVRTVAEVVTVVVGDTAAGPQRDAVTATPEHPLYVIGKGWTGAGRLCVGDALATRAGPPLIVQRLTWGHRPEGYVVYNLTVQGDHTYFVGRANGGVWAHNVLCYRQASGSVDSMTPRLRDQDGLSAWNTPGKAGGPGEKIQEINTDEFANLTEGTMRPDGHYSIAPKDPSQMADWIASRGSGDPHPLTQELLNATRYWGKLPK